MNAVDVHGNAQLFVEVSKPCLDGILILRIALTQGDEDFILTFVLGDIGTEIRFWEIRRELFRRDNAPYELCPANTQSIQGKTTACGGEPTLLCEGV